MKKLYAILIACLVVVLAACSSDKTPSYSPETVKALLTKCQSNEELTQDEYSEMIGQCSAIMDLIAKKADEVKDLQGEALEQKQAEILADPEYMDMMQSFMTLGVYVNMNRDKLDASNIEKLDQLEKKSRELAE